MAVTENMELQIYPSIYKLYLALFDHFPIFHLRLGFKKQSPLRETLEKPPINRPSIKKGICIAVKALPSIKKHRLRIHFAHFLLAVRVEQGDHHCEATLGEAAPPSKRRSSLRLGLCRPSRSISENRF